jgi:UDP:flavonoid glycosyltransferase YjiC (YdhE family)
MRLTLVGLGSRGDVEPFVALGEGLQASGHEVTILTHAMFEGMVTSRNLKYRLLSGNVTESLNTKESREVLETGGEAYRLFSKLREDATPHVDTALDEMIEAFKLADHVICSPITLHATCMLADDLGIKYTIAAVNPAGPTRAFHNVLFPPAPEFLPKSMQEFYNVRSHLLTDKFVWSFLKPLMNPVWRKRFGKSLPKKDPLRASFEKNLPLLLFGYSKYVLPKPADWSPLQFVTGYWFLKNPVKSISDPELIKFLESGDKPVFIGFGSMNDAEGLGNRLIDMALNVANKTGKRVIILKPAKYELPKEANEKIYLTNPVPFELLFPHLSLAIHHGGAGTTAAGLRAGIPQVITPLISDQRFWSWRVYKLGTGPKPIPWKKLNDKRLIDAVNSVFASSTMASTAKTTGEQIRAEDGVKNAVDIFNSVYVKQ